MGGRLLRHFLISIVSRKEEVRGAVAALFLSIDCCWESFFAERVWRAALEALGFPLRRFSGCYEVCSGESIEWVSSVWVAHGEVLVVHRTLFFLTLGWATLRGFFFIGYCWCGGGYIGGVGGDGDDVSLDVAAALAGACLLLPHPTSNPFVGWCMMHDKHRVTTSHPNTYVKLSG